jgi:hypothetical protein
MICKLCNKEIPSNHVQQGGYHMNCFEEANTPDNNSRDGAAEKFPPRRLLAREYRGERAVWAFADQPESAKETCDEYLSIIEHEDIVESEKAKALEKCPNEAWECTKIQRRLEGELAAEKLKSKKLLRQIQAHCGHPDAAAGCRIILKAIAEHEKDASK